MMSPIALEMARVMALRLASPPTANTIRALLSSNGIGASDADVSQILKSLTPPKKARKKETPNG